MASIPFMDLGLQFKSLESEIRAAIDEVLRAQSFIQGPMVEKFNKAFLELHGGDFGFGCANGTSAITVALRTLGIGPGDEVLVPNHTFFGTLEPIVEVGATPVLVEIDNEFGQLDLEYASLKVTPKTKAIIPVHLYGLPEPMDRVMDFAKTHGLKVIEDCAQAHLAKWHGQSVGTFGDMATFSFYPGKNLGAFGDAGFIIAKSQAHFEFARRYIDHGRTDKYVHDFFGSNVRMDGLQAAVLNVKLTKMPEWTKRRLENAKIYDQELTSAGFKVLRPREQAAPVYHLYVVEVANRQEVIESLAKVGISCGVHYPITMNCQPALSRFGYQPGQFPISERRAERILSLPFFPELQKEQIELVVNHFKRVARP